MSRVAVYNPVLDRPTDLLLPLAFSFVLHAILVWLFAGAFGEPQNASAPLSVEILKPEEARRLEEPRRPATAVPVPSAEEPPPARPDTQIVSPPESPEAVPDNPRFLSDRDSRADQETVKRGEPAPPAEPPRELARPARPKVDSPAPQAVAPKRPAEPSGPRASDLPGLESLFASPSELLGDPRIAKGSKAPAPAPSDDSPQTASLPRPELWSDPGERGTPDYLPDVRQGKFTLLNTKADLFAPFVRRVGLRVFQTFSMDFKRRILSGNVPQGEELEAVMSRDGRRLDVFLRKRSGNLATDRVLLATLSDHIFFDENPPAKAVAADGRIHFIFALDAAVWYGREEGSGLARPGAQWIFGAGLL
jgi:hypothetical protein